MGDRAILSSSHVDKNLGTLIALTCFSGVSKWLLPSVQITRGSCSNTPTGNHGGSNGHRWHLLYRVYLELRPRTILERHPQSTVRLK